jgi:hypothetical protein
VCVSVCVCVCVCVCMCVCVLVDVRVHACVRAQTRARVYAHGPGATAAATLSRCNAHATCPAVKVLDDDVELVRGPNCLGPVAKRGLHNPRRVAAISKPRSADAQEEDGFLGSRLVGKVNDYTLGTDVLLMCS